MKKVLVSIAIVLLSFANSCFASQNIPLVYNIIPDISNNYVVDTTHTNQITFSLFESGETLYYNNSLLKIENNKFAIDTQDLTGKNTFEISNASGECVTYTYYFSDKKGYLKDYSMPELDNKKYKTYIKTIEDVSIIYTEKDSKTIKKLETIISKLPKTLLENLSEIKLLPLKHTSGATGVTKYDKITLYNISSYSTSTIKNVVIHEIAHTWAYKLMENKKIDYSYTDYKLAVDTDEKFPSNYAKENVKQGNYSEDFAESVSFFLINQKSFAKKYPARADYINKLLK